MLSVLQCPLCNHADRLNFEDYGYSCDYCGTGLFRLEYTDVLTLVIHQWARRLGEQELLNVRGDIPVAAAGGMMEETEKN